MVVKIDKKAFEGMRKHAEEGYPNEVCGVMIGKNGIVTDYRRCRNLNTERARDRYELDPLSFSEADEYARGNSLEILGIYHSHPDHPSLASETDRKRAWPGWGYIIFSVNKGRFNNAKLWYLNEKNNRFQEQEYVVTGTGNKN